SLDAHNNRPPATSTSNQPAKLPFPCASTRLYLSSCRSERGNGVDDKLDLPQGTLDLLILKAVSLGPMHGWAISERIRDVSKATLQIPQGSLYPALHRLPGPRGWSAA